MSEDKEESIKEAFMRITKREAIELMDKVITHNFIKLVVISWLVISVAASIYRRYDDRCDKKIQLDSYFFGKLLCEVP